jgi:hypothetical protein
LQPDISLYNSLHPWVTMRKTDKTAFLSNTLFYLVASLTIKQIVFEKIPVFGISIIIAELFYKFHSFTLELLAFMATWFLLDICVRFIFNQLKLKS